MGLERGQRRHQHHDQARARHAGHASQRDGRHGRAAARPRATAASSASRVSFACSASTPTATRRSIRARRASDDWRIGHAGFRADWDANEQRCADAAGRRVSREHRPARARRSTSSGAPGPTGNLEVHVSRRQRARTLAPSARGPARTCSCAPITTARIATIRAFTTISTRSTWTCSIASCRSRGTRSSGARTTATPTTAIAARGSSRSIPKHSRDQLFSGFVQDQFAISDALRLTLGTKLEHNDFSGFEVQPSVRLAWDVAPRQNAWAAVSRAVRVPTRLERDIAIEATPPGSNPRAVLLGNDDFECGRAARVRSSAIAGSRSTRWRSTWRCSTTATKDSRRWSSARRRSIRAAASSRFRS